VFNGDGDHQAMLKAPAGRHWTKTALWMLMGAATLLVALYSEVPLFRQAKERAYLSTIPFLIVPHVMGGVLALLIGPIQFSNRLRRRYLPFHRMLGKIYVVSVLVAAPLAIALSTHRHDRRAIHFAVAVFVQASTWMITTLAAFFTARNGYIQQHREWMIRSYAVTFTFVGTRVLQPIPAWNRHSEAGFAMEIIMITFLAILVPDIAFHWRQLTTRRPKAVAAKAGTNERRPEEEDVTGRRQTSLREIGSN
jgi:uncharacterized membrane protein